jgi:hypothetical protein
MAIWRPKRASAWQLHSGVAGPRQSTLRLSRFGGVFLQATAMFPCRRAHWTSPIRQKKAFGNSAVVDGYLVPQTEQIRNLRATPWSVSDG